MQVQNSNFKLETAPTEAIQNWLVNQLAQQLSINPTTIKATEPLTRYGLDSIDAVTLVGDLEDWLDVELPSTLFWDHPTIEKSAQFLVENYENDLGEALRSIDLKQPVAVAEEKTETAATAANSKKGWGNLFGRMTSN
jgi:acyl carrier protein